MIKPFGFAASAVFSGFLLENCREIRETVEKELNDFIDDVEPLLRGETYC